jgi:hypothetical protein
MPHREVEGLLLVQGNGGNGSISADPIVDLGRRKQSAASSASKPTLAVDAIG